MLFLLTSCIIVASIDKGSYNMNAIFEGLNHSEAEILIWIQEHLRNPILTVFFNLITTVGEKGIGFILFAVILFCLRKTRRYGTFFCTSIVINVALVNLILKNLFERTRPFLLSAMEGKLTPAAWNIPDSFSFPSGHTAIAFATAIVAFFCLKKRYAILLTVLAVLVAFSRLYLGVHYPTDVLFGALFGSFSAVSAALLIRAFSKKFGDTWNEKIPNMF